MNKKVLGIFVIVIVVAIIAVYFMFFQKVTVTFNSQMGTSVSAQEVKKGGTVIKPNDPTYEGYTFEGWYLNDSLFDFNTKVEESITLIGKWHKNN